MKNSKQHGLFDWANNRLTDKSGHLLSFNSFDDGWCYICENYDEEEYEELFIMSL